MEDRKILYHSDITKKRMSLQKQWKNKMKTYQGVNYWSLTACDSNLFYSLKVWGRAPSISHVAITKVEPFQYNNTEIIIFKKFIKEMT